MISAVQTGNAGICWYD